MSHFYTRDGQPAHFAGPNGRPTGPATAKKLGLLPSVSTVIDGVLRKPALERWLITQAVTAVTTAPDVPGEGLDAKIERVLNTERQADEEAKIARDRGTDIHAACEAWLIGQPVDPELLPWIVPACQAVLAYGKVKATERIVIGDGYAGKTDLVLDGEFFRWWLFDFKSCRRLPEKGAYLEHQIQLGAYAEAWQDNSACGLIRTANCYISTVDKGKFVIWDHPDWQMCYERGFLPLLTVWRLMNNWTSGK